MSAPITEAHIDLVRYVLDAEWYGTNVEKKFAQEIADSEARACEQLRADCDNETKWAAHYLADALAAKARAERAEAELASIRSLANRRNKQDHSQDTTHQLVASLDQALDIAQTELATERARLDWLVKSSDNPLAINLIPSYGWREVKKTFAPQSTQR